MISLETARKLREYGVIRRDDGDLKRILDAIEREGYLYEVAVRNREKYPTLCKYDFHVIRKGETWDSLEFGLSAGTPEEAAAAVLLWLKERDAK